MKEHECLSKVHELGACYDQLNVPVLACKEPTGTVGLGDVLVAYH